MPIRKTMTIEVHVQPENMTDDELYVHISRLEELLHISIDERSFRIDQQEPNEPDDGLTDIEADAMTLASAGWGTDEDYGGSHDFDHVERDHDEEFLCDE